MNASVARLSLGLALAALCAPVAQSRRRLEPFIGHRVCAAVDWEDDDRGGQTMTATEVKVAGTKGQ